MEEIIAPVSDITFDIEVALENQVGALPLPFSGMDKSGSAVCTFFRKSSCTKGALCPFRHIRDDRTVVCKHWLRGLCKKGDECEFLHEFDSAKMPECYFFSKFGQCNNKECLFLHISPEYKVKDCPWYNRGFCRHGPHCKNRHVRRVMCQCYMNGFCLDGPNCKYVHPSFAIPTPDPQVQARKMSIVCHSCGMPGHKAAFCPYSMNNPIPTCTKSQARDKPTRVRRPLDQVTCYKCGQKGHYANKCPKGHLAFLSPLAGDFTYPPPPFYGGGNDFKF